MEKRAKASPFYLFILKKDKIFKVKWPCERHLDSDWLLVCCLSLNIWCLDIICVEVCNYLIWMFKLLERTLFYFINYVSTYLSCASLILFSWAEHVEILLIMRGGETWTQDLCLFWYHVEMCATISLKSLSFREKTHFYLINLCLHMQYGCCEDKM